MQININAQTFSYDASGGKSVCLSFLFLLGVASPLIRVGWSYAGVTMRPHRYIELREKLDEFPQLFSSIVCWSRRDWKLFKEKFMIRFYLVEGTKPPQLMLSTEHWAQKPLHNGSTWRMFVYDRDCRFIAFLCFHQQRSQNSSKIRFA
jgi:hypothetical protein